MRKRMLAVAALVTTAALAACDAGGATGPRDAQLTAAQAASLNRALLNSGAQFANGSVPAGARGARSTNAVGSGAFSFTFDTTVPCTPSGNTGVAGTLGGSVDALARSGTVQANLAFTHHDCAIKADDGTTFTLNGDPRIDVTLNAASGETTGLTAFQLTEVGAFNWTRGDGSSGHCNVNVSANLVAGTQTVQLAGTFCGFAVNGIVPVTS
ncbi:MAG TPA: hypothetical protein VFJ82_19290 [Longimicrobium sp.]|nr:hypothetical protein [Longimicrobium sp.]